MNQLVYPEEPLPSFFEYIQMNQPDLPEWVLQDILTWLIRIYSIQH